MTTMQNKIEIPEDVIGERLIVLENAIHRHPLNREVLYRILVYCVEERTLADLEQEIVSWPQFKTATQNQYRLAECLVCANGLEKIERDKCGDVIPLENKENLDEDAIDDLIHSISYHTTEIGRYFIKQYCPRIRLGELLRLVPDRTDAYIKLLEFVHVQPRTYKDIVEFSRECSALETIIGGAHRTMQPSVFVDKLEHSGALVWDEGWRLTKEGELFLQDLKANGENHF